MAVPVPLNVQASGSSSAYGQTGAIRVGGASFGAPGGGADVIQQVVVGVLVAVVVALILKQKG